MKHSIPFIITGLIILSVSFARAQDKQPLVTPKDTTHKGDTVKQKPDSILHATLATSGSINKAIGNTSYLLNNDLKLAMKE